MVIISLAEPKIVQAQTGKTFQGTNPMSQTVQQPYLTYEEFRLVMVRASNGHVPLQKLLTVSFLEGAVRLLSEPRSTECNGGFTWLHYGGEKGLP